MEFVQTNENSIIYIKDVHLNIGLQVVICILISSSSLPVYRVLIKSKDDFQQLAQVGESIWFRYFLTLYA